MRPLQFGDISVAMCEYSRRQFPCSAYIYRKETGYSMSPSAKYQVKDVANEHIQSSGQGVCAKRDQDVRDAFEEARLGGDAGDTLSWESEVNQVRRASLANHSLCSAGLCFRCMTLLGSLEISGSTPRSSVNVLIRKTGWTRIYHTSRNAAAWVSRPK